MKKFLAILVLGLLWCNVGVAGHCGHDMDRSWKYSADKRYAVWTFKNETDKSIIISSIGLYAEGSKKKMTVDKREIYLKPYGIEVASIYVGDLNLDVAGSGFTTCRYGSKPVSTYTPPKKKKKTLLEKVFGD